VTPFRDSPIRHKAALLIGVAGVIALVVTAASLILYDLATVRPRGRRDLQAQADLLRVNTAAALAFNDSTAARENLATLRARPEIGAAALYDRTGRLLAAYARNPASNRSIPARAPTRGVREDGAHIVLREPVKADGENVGDLVLWYTLPRLSTRLSQYGLVVALVGVALVTVSALLLWLLRVQLSRPLLTLADTARAITERRDYGVRAAKHGHDEVGQLTDAFNSMLAAIEARDAALQQSAAQLREAMQATKMCSWHLDVASGSMRWQGDEGRLFGPDSAPKGASLDAFIEVVHPADRPELERAIQRAAEAWAKVELDLRVVGPGERVRWLALQGRAAENGSAPDSGIAHKGPATRLVGLIQDVTDRHHLEEQLLQSQKMEAIGRLAGGIAHDFNNLLTVILGYASLALDAIPADSGAREDMREIENAGVQAATLTAQLLAYARRQIIAPRLVDLNTMVNNLRPMLTRLLGEHITVGIQPGAKLWPVKVDPGQFEQVVLNLSVNARDAMPTGGSLTFETSNTSYLGGEAHLAGLAPGDYVVLVARDTGQGIDQETRARLFEPFFTTKPQGEGTGLGLAMCYGIVTQAGGLITVDSAPGEGATFSIYLPSAANAPSEVPESSPAPGPAPRGGETILVVEDDPTLRALAIRVLESCGYAVVAAASPREALPLAAQHQVDLLLTDVVMPERSGRDLALELRDEVPGLRVLYMSGYTSDEVVARGVHEASADFLQKPFSPSTLARRVRETLNSAPRPGPTPTSAPT
jgi:two-component system cell cycle sensor histidine kinase/response regulator CckA